MILAASPNTIRSLARKAGLRAADVYIEDVSQEGTRATEVYLRNLLLDYLDTAADFGAYPRAIDWVCDIQDRYPRLVQCQTCGYLTSPEAREEFCPACLMPD